VAAESVGAVSLSVETLGPLRRVVLGRAPELRGDAFRERLAFAHHLIVDVIARIIDRI